MGSSMSETDSVIVLDDVSKTFWVERTRETVDAVESCTLDVRRGEFFTLVGPSGCGKTTILGMIAGFESPSSGRITMHGETVHTTSAERGMLFQEYALLPWKTGERQCRVRPQIRTEKVLKGGTSRDRATPHRSRPPNRLGEQVSTRALRRYAPAMCARQASGL